MRLCVVFTLQDVHPDQFRFLWSTPDLSLEIVFRLERETKRQDEEEGMENLSVLHSQILYCALLNIVVPLLL